jgi:hypothetical protein
MSNPIPRKTIEKSLLSKGFVLCQEDRDHRFYHFFYKGKKTMARTKISTGTAYGEYGDSLFKLMVQQLQLQNVRQVRNLLACPMSLEEYTSLLVGRGCISPAQ